MRRGGQKSTRLEREKAGFLVPLGIMLRNHQGLRADRLPGAAPPGEYAPEFGLDRRVARRDSAHQRRPILLCGRRNNDCEQEGMGSSLQKLKIRTRGAGLGPMSDTEQPYRSEFYHLPNGMWAASQTAQNGCRFRHEFRFTKLTGTNFDEFSPDGALVRRFEHGPWLNSPWGVALAPSNFGRLSGRLLVGNFGSGQIAAYSPSGEFEGLMRGRRGKPITIDGLWGLGFGNDTTAGPANVLFFAAGIQDEDHGLFGTLSPVAKKGKDNQGNRGDKGNHDNGDK